MRLTASSCNPAQHTSSTMVQNYLSHSFYKTFSKPAAVPLVRSVAASVMFCCAQPWCVAIAWVVRQIDQRSRTVNRVDFFRLCCAPQFFTGFSWNQARSTVWCTFCRTHLPKVLRTWQLYIYIYTTFWSANRAALTTVSCAFCRPHLPKVLGTWHLFYVLKCQSSSRYSPVRWLLKTFPARAPNPRKQRPYFGDPGSHFTRKNTGFRRVFSPVNSPVPELLHFLATWGWVVDMMMWLTWLEMLTMAIVRNAEVF